jgi:hypothetical protein
VSIDGPIDVLIGGRVYAQLIPEDLPGKIQRQSRMRKLVGGEEVATLSDYQFDLRSGTKVAAHGPKNLAFVTFYHGSQRGFVSVKDRAQTASFHLKHLRGLTLDDLEELHYALEIVLTEVEGAVPTEEQQ